MNHGVESSSDAIFLYFLGQNVMIYSVKSYSRTVLTSCGGAAPSNCCHIEQIYLIAREVQQQTMEAFHSNERRMCAPASGGSCDPVPAALSVEPLQYGVVQVLEGVCRGAQNDGQNDSEDGAHHGAVDGDTPGA